MRTPGAEEVPELSKTIRIREEARSRKRRGDTGESRKLRFRPIDIVSDFLLPVIPLARLPLGRVHRDQILGKLESSLRIYVLFFQNDIHQLPVRRAGKSV